VKKVSFWPRAAVEKMEPPENSVLISVFDRSDGPLARYHPKWVEVLQLRFHDTDGSQLGLELCQLEHATQIFDLLARHPDCHEVVVHCAQGKSRSAAIALYLGESRNVPCLQQDKKVARPYFFANGRVTACLCDADPENTFLS